MRIQMLLTALLAALLLVVAVAPVLAFTESETETEVVEEDQGSELGIIPAVESTPVAEEEADSPWTQRFLAPAVLALGVLGLAGSVAYYGLRIRGKYKVAQ